MLDEYTSALALADSLQSRIVLSQTYLGSATDAAYLRTYIVNEVKSYYGVDAAIFDTGSITATTLVRDFLHKLVYFQDEFQTYSQLVSAGQALPLQLDIAPLLRHPAWAACGEISWQVFQVYRALGYECRLVDTLNGSTNSFSDSHVFIEVRDPITGQYFIQDPTYNVAHVAPDGTLLNLLGLRELALDHPGEHLSQTLGGTIYTTFSINGVSTTNLDAPIDDFVTAGALVTPWRIVSSEGTDAVWADFRDDRKAAVADDVELKALVASAKQDGLDFNATVHQLAAHYDLYGIEFVDTSAIPGVVLVARVAGGGDLSIDFDTLAVVAGGVDTHWAALARGETAGLPGIDYSDAYRMVGANGIEAAYGIDAAQPQQPPAGPLDFSYANGYGMFQVAMDSASTVKSITIDSANREPWANWSEYRNLENGTLLKLIIGNDDGSRYEANWDVDEIQPWALREEAFSNSGDRQVLRVVNDDASSYRAQYDLNNSQPWALREEVFGSSGALQVLRIENDDASIYRAQYDLNNSEPWALREDVFNSSGTLSVSQTTNDDGSIYHARWDVDNTQSWSLSETLIDAEGRTYTKSLTQDDGARWLYLYDVQNMNPWTSIERHFTADGQLATETTLQDDGSRTERVWDLDNTATWSSVESVFDAFGTLLTQTYFPDPLIL